MTLEEDNKNRNQITSHQILSARQVLSSKCMASGFSEQSQLPLTFNPNQRMN